MKKLLGQRMDGSILEQDFLHIGDDGRKKITTVRSEDVAPVFESVKRQAQTGYNKNMGRLVCEIPETVLVDVARGSARTWGVKVRDALAEIVKGKTDRAQDALKVMKFGRDYRKLQTNYYA